MDPIVERNLRTFFLQNGLNTDEADILIEFTLTQSRAATLRGVDFGADVVVWNALEFASASDQVGLAFFNNYVETVALNKVEAERAKLERLRRAAHHSIENENGHNIYGTTYGGWVNTENHEENLVRLQSLLWRANDSMEQEYGHNIYGSMYGGWVSTENHEENLVHLQSLLWRANDSMEQECGHNIYGSTCSGWVNLPNNSHEEEI